MKLERGADPAPFLYVVGAPRSGTTLLALILESSLGVAIPVETHFIPYFHAWRGLWGDLGSPGNRSRLLAAILDFLEIWTPRALSYRSMEEARPFTLLAVRNALDSGGGGGGSYGDIVRGLFSAYADSRGAAYCGDKSAYYYPVDLSRLDDATPGARFIHMVRDGRDVSLSWTSMWSGPPSVSAAARLWQAHVSGARRWGLAHESRYLEVRYEDLLDNPDACLDRLGAFLGRPAARLAFDTHGLAKVLNRGGLHDRLTGPLDRLNRDKWKSSMSADQVVRFESVARRALETFGYEASSRSAPGPRPDAARSTPRRGSSLTVGLLRRLKPALPPAIFAARAVGLSLPSMLNRRR